jgi:TonB family protein
MKKIIPLFLLLFSAIIWQGCGSESKEEAREAIAKAEETKKAEARAEKKARFIKASAERTEQRKLAAAERAKLSLTYTDAYGKVIYNKAEIDPSYSGGMDELTKYLNENLKYPNEAREKGLEGTVFVEFVINEKGQVREVVASDVVGEDVDLSFKEEAIRVVAAMPGWKAGLQNGRPVDAAFSIPVTFELTN